MFGADWRARAQAKRAFGLNRWEHFITADWSDDRQWSEYYKSGKHRAIWDHSYPSPELIGYVAGANLRNRARVLDVGCGSGKDAVFLASRNLDVYGLDFSTEALQLAERRAHEQGVVVSWHHANVLSAPFEHAFFDLVTDRGCFHYFDAQQRKKYADEMARILKPGGVLLLRGCRCDVRPFHSIDSIALKETFDERLFEIGTDTPIFLVVDAGGIPATLVRIVRRVA